MGGKRRIKGPCVKRSADGVSWLKQVEERWHVWKDCFREEVRHGQQDNEKIR